MYDASDNLPTEDEIVAAVTRMQDERNDLRAEVARLEDVVMHLEHQLEQREAADPPVIVTVNLPHGRRWSFVEDANVLAISPYVDDDTRRRLIAQTAARLTTCDCGAPRWRRAGPAASAELQQAPPPGER